MKYPMTVEYIDGGKINVVAISDDGKKGRLFKSRIDKKALNTTSEARNQKDVIVEQILARKKEPSEKN